VCLVGFGTVGQALARLIAGRPELASSLQIVAVADRGGVAARPAGLEAADWLERKASRGSVATDPRPPSLAEWVAATDSDAVVDVLPSNLDSGEPSRTIALEALRSGKDVVTANKGPLALHAGELRAAARASGRAIRSGAAVGGGTPVLELLTDSFRGDRVERFDAVLNGTTNFVLAHLERGSTWEGALAAARARGILESDPSLDLSGRDAAAKATILANALWQTDWSLADARVEGIWGTDERDARDASEHGLALRLVARADPEGGVRVAPVALPREHALVMDGPENMVRFRLAAAGTVAVRGPGAGGTESAAKVLSDLLALRERPRPD